MKATSLIEPTRQDRDYDIKIKLILNQNMVIVLVNTFR
jgi:hypothetical protein